MFALPNSTDKCNMFFFGLLELKEIMPEHMREAYTSWSHQRVDKSINKIWVMIPEVSFWYLWNERNRICFDGISTPSSSLKAKCLLSLYS